ncbi:hypothetical protein BH10ACT7_BH10ACT7_06350 [soil metagenome]
MTDDETLGTIDDLGAATDVEPLRERGQLTRLIASLVLAGLVLGALIAGATWFLTGFSQTEAGLCRQLPAPCTSLSLESVERYAEIDLPDGTEVVSAYYQESASSLEFRAEVLLPGGASSQPLVPVYELLEGDWSESIPAVAGRSLNDVSYWYRQVGGLDSALAAQGMGPDGRLVVFFDTLLAG